MPSKDFRYKQNRVQQLRGFCYAAADGSISKAAERMYLSQPSVSMQIQALERELDVTLFERRGPRIHLTPDGELLFEMAMPLVEQLDALPDEFAQRRGNIDQGRIDLAAGWSTILYVMPQFVERFRSENPNIELKLHNVTGAEGLAQLRAGHVDFAVGPLLEIPEDIDFHPIVSYEPLLITAPGHPLSKKENLSLKQISKYPFILPPRHLSTWSTVDSVFKKQGLPYEVAMEVGGWEVIKKYVELGLGISVVMSICITGGENLAVIPANQWFPNRTYGVVLRKGKILTPQAKRFITMMLPDFV
ncbi:MAG: LysR family transcriptional regulator [Candidatus Hydrogenedens sp.]|nr:LysR family transcriptional regulator [Candidatus Hydrogenedens sp.]